MKTVFIGSVKLSLAALETLYDLGVKLDLVCSLDESASAQVCDYAPLHAFAKENGIPCITFSKVAELNVLIADISPDIMFVIGISQIIPEEILLSAKLTIGFHPTPLPKYRGRAPIPWMILLEEENPKTSFFALDAGMDSGDILHQEPYHIGANDHSTEVYNAVCDAIKTGLRKCVPNLYAGTAVFTPQKHEDATYLLIRRPEDGRIDWHEDAKTIYNIIRAAAPPYPGAFTMYKGENVIVTRASIQENNTVFGIPGQIYKVEDGRVFTIAKGGYFVIFEQCAPSLPFRVGTKFL